ncbi:MAG: thiol-disulfide isomerase/thioredoxin [Myxococcota bacterium]|jgi:thiol-disulfide isomerase/thioredoxin
MSTLLLIGLATAGEPTVEGAWKKGAAWLTVQAPSGEHLNAEGPLSGWLEVGGVRLEVGGHGSVLSGGLALAAQRGAEVSGSLSVPLCEDDGGACRVTRVDFCGTPARKAVAFASTQPPPPPTAAPHAASVETAMTEAASTGRLVLLDFGAVWCPPCNLLSAELLEDPDDAGALSGFVVVAVDADDPSSWAVKDRYDVGGYPTLIIARPDGAEVDRMVGYPGESQTLDWLADAPGVTALSALPEPTAGPEAAGYALRFMKQGDADQARAWLAVAEPDAVDFRLARLSLAASAEDVRWLIAHDAAIGDWVWDALGLCEGDADLTAEVRAAIRKALPGASSLLSADLLWAAAGLSEDPETLYAAGAAALTAGLSGDPDLDRGHYTFLAQLHERAGDSDAGLAVLAGGVTHYPEEFTFHYAAAGMLLRAERLDEALVSINATLPHSYGDNALRTAKRKAEILHALGQTAEAIALIDATLDAAPRPSEDLKVRTPRYIAALEALRVEMAEG